MTTTLEAPVEPQAPEVAALSEETSKELIALREGGMTLAELKTRFPQLTSEQIREVLPAGNARERKAKAAKTEVTKGVGGRSGKAKSEPKVEAPKPEPTPRYVEDQDIIINLSERALACRQVVGRGKLAERLDTTQSAVWRFEQGRIHPNEVEGLKAGLDAVEKRIASGEFVKAEAAPKVAQPTKAELLHRVEATVTYLRDGTKGLSGKAVAEAALALLDPPVQS
jgi:ribosome-binding protein aMBF1 (putative translation factor)